ncbi:MAG: Arm DNA-binding domain-containing protein, partial [Rhodomicrobium sp.]
MLAAGTKRGYFTDNVPPTQYWIPPTLGLTDISIKNAKPKDRPYKLADGEGMYLLIKPDGGRYWRLKY